MSDSSVRTAPSTSMNRKVNFVGHWRNQHGSEMEIKAITDDLIIGTFKSGVGGIDPELEFPLTGFVSDDLIAFSVNFKQFQSVTSWSGQHTISQDEEVIETMWHLARAIPDAAERTCLWAGIWTGADSFTRVQDLSEGRQLHLFDRPPFLPSYPFKASKKG